jgi:deoxyribodipyrimidine photo-lyase
VPNGFATFHERIQKLLTDFFTDATTPIDPEILDHLNHYFKDKNLASSYFETRNQLIGDHYSTGMSAYLSSGHLDVRYLYNEVKKFETKFGSNKSSQWIIYELCWREYFYWHYKRHGCSYFSRAGIKGIKNFEAFEIYDFQTLHQIKSCDFFHAALNELEQTGHMSNRARQMFASFWINDLALDWRSGAKLFEENLIDYDVYSNYGNWMYLAGVGVDPRGKRYFDITKQLNSYDPANLYLKRWL